MEEGSYFKYSSKKLLIHLVHNLHVFPCHYVVLINISVLPCYIITCIHLYFSYLSYLHIFTNTHNCGECSKDSKTAFIKVRKSSEQFTMTSNRRCNWKLIR